MLGKPCLELTREKIQHNLKQNGNVHVPCTLYNLWPQRLFLGIERTWVGALFICWNAYNVTKVLNEYLVWFTISLYGFF